VSGENEAWIELAALDPGDVCARAAVEYSPATGYTVPVFGLPMIVDPATQTFEATDSRTEFLLTKTAYFSRISLLYYLLKAQNIPPFDNLLKPQDLKSRLLYFTGSHVLPLEPIAARFSNDPEGLLAQGARYGGQPRSFGDAAVELLPLPRVPLTVILWEADEEFAARAYLLFDEVCELQLPADILWSAAMMTAIAMFKG
jgi:hypothetical protein